MLVNDVGDKILVQKYWWLITILFNINVNNFIGGKELELLDVTRPSININMEDGIKAKTTNPPVANTETEIQIDRFV